MNKATRYASQFSKQLRSYAALPEIAAHPAIVSMIERFERAVTQYGEQVQRICDELDHKSGANTDSSAALANLADAGNSLTHSADLLHKAITAVSDAKPDLADVVADKVAEFATSLDTAARASVEKLRGYDVRAALGGLNLRRPGLADIAGVVDRVSTAGSFLRKAAANIVPNTKEAAGKVKTAAKNAASKAVDASVEYAVRRALTAQFEPPVVESSVTSVAQSIKDSADKLISLSEQATAEAGSKLFDSHLEKAVKGVEGLSAAQVLEMLGSMVAGPSASHGSHAHDGCSCGDHTSKSAQAAEPASPSSGESTSPANPRVIFHELLHGGLPTQAVETTSLSSGDSTGPAMPVPENPCLIFPTDKGVPSTGPAPEKKPTRKRAAKTAGDTPAMGTTGATSSSKGTNASKKVTDEKPKAPRKRKTKSEKPVQS